MFGLFISFFYILFLSICQRQICSVSYTVDIKLKTANVGILTTYFGNYEWGKCRFLEHPKLPHIILYLYKSAGVGSKIWDYGKKISPFFLYMSASLKRSPEAHF